MAVWGSAIALLIIGLQSWVIALAPDNAEFASALYVMAFNIGIGGGAMAGGLMLERLGTASLLYAGIGIALAGLMVWAYTARAWRAVYARG